MRHGLAQEKGDNEELRIPSDKIAQFDVVEEFESVLSENNSIIKSTREDLRVCFDSAKESVVSGVIGFSSVLPFVTSNEIVNLASLSIIFLGVMFMAVRAEPDSQLSDVFNLSYEALFVIFISSMPFTFLFYTDNEDGWTILLTIIIALIAMYNFKREIEEAYTDFITSFLALISSTIFIVIVSEVQVDIPQSLELPIAFVVGIFLSALICAIFYGTVAWAKSALKFASAMEKRAKPKIEEVYQKFVGMFQSRIG